MFTNHFVLAFVIPNGSPSILREVMAVTASDYVDVVIVASDHPSIQSEARMLEAVDFAYSPVGSDEPSVDTLSAYFASPDVEIAPDSDPLILVIEGEQSDLTGEIVTEALDRFFLADGIESMVFDLPGARFKAVTHDSFLRTGLVTQENALVLAGR